MHFINNFILISAAYLQFKWRTNCFAYLTFVNALAGGKKRKLEIPPTPHYYFVAKLFSSTRTDRNKHDSLDEERECRWTDLRRFFFSPLIHEFTFTSGGAIMKINSVIFYSDNPIP